MKSCLAQWELGSVYVLSFVLDVACGLSSVCGGFGAISILSKVIFEQRSAMGGVSFSSDVINFPVEKLIITSFCGWGGVESIQMLLLTFAVCCYNNLDARS